jgi:tripartite-type tricarboxylate transporter receptor subunit TctC
MRAKGRGMFKRLACCLSFAAGFFAVVHPGLASAADDFPTKLIRIVVPFAPGGPTDLIARGLARQFSNVWKQSVIVENRTGAGGIIGLKVALEAPRDGYTLVVHSDAMSIAPAIYDDLPFDVMKDFKAVALLAHTPNAVVVGEDSPYHSLQELAQAGHVSGKLSYASAGIGSAQHMQTAKFANLASLSDPVHVPFKGTPEGLNAIMAGNVDFMFAPLSNAAPLIKAGKVRALAISSAERSPFLPDVQTVAAAGFSGYAEEQYWGLFVPVGVPEDITAKIETATRDALATPEMKTLVEQLSSTIGDKFGKDFSNELRSDIAANILAAKAGNIHAN